MYCIFSFKSRQEAMRLYDLAKRNKIFVTLISTPKFVSAGCGLSVKTSIDNYANLYNLFVSLRFSSFLGAYRVRDVNGKIYSEKILY
jgi:hypothetical protein